MYRSSGFFSPLTNIFCRVFFFSSHIRYKSPVAIIVLQLGLGSVVVFRNAVGGGCGYGFSGFRRPDGDAEGAVLGADDDCFAGKRGAGAAEQFPAEGSHAEVVRKYLLVE